MTILEKLTSITASISTNAAAATQVAQQLSTQAATATAASAGLAEMRDGLIAIADEVQALESSDTATQLAAAQAQVASLMSELSEAKAALAAEELGAADLADQLIAAQADADALTAALAAAQAGGGSPPPAGNPLRISGSIDTQHGGSHGTGAWDWIAFTADCSAVAARGSVTLDIAGAYSIDLTAPFLVGEPVPMLFTRHDDAGPFDRTVYASFGWVQAGAV